MKGRMYKKVEGKYVGKKKEKQKKQQTSG